MKRINFLLLVYFLSILGVIILVLYYPNLGLYNQPQKLMENWGGEIKPCLEDQLFCNNKTNKNRFVLIGDSHAMQLYFGLAEIYGDDKVILLSSSLFADKWFKDLSSNEISKIKDFVDVNLNSSDTVLLSIAHHHLFSRRYSENYKKKVASQVIESLIQHLKKKNIALILINDNPRLSINLPISICIKQIAFNNKSDCDVNRNYSLGERWPLTEVYSDLAIKYDIKIFDVFNIICPGETCSPILNSELMFIDQNHITKHASFLVAKNFKIFFDGNK